MKEGETVQVSVLWSAFPIASLLSLPARAVYSRNLYEDRVQPQEGIEHVCDPHQLEVTPPDSVSYQSKSGFSRRE